MRSLTPLVPLFAHSFITDSDQIGPKIWAEERGLKIKTHSGEEGGFE